MNNDTIVLSPLLQKSYLSLKRIMRVVIGIGIHLALCSVVWDVLAQAKKCDEISYDNDKVGNT